MKSLIKRILREMVEYPFSKVIVVSIINSNGHKYTIRTEVPTNDEEQKQGMMIRDGMCDDCGMLFTIKNTAGFHMNDVKFPIDMVFIKDNKIINIINAKPGDKHIESPSDATHNLEISGGYCEDNNIKVGDQVIF